MLELNLNKDLEVKQEWVEKVHLEERGFLINNLTEMMTKSLSKD